jgi:phage baseplate assembly protein W
VDFNFKNSGRSVLDVFDETKEKLEEKKKIPYGIKTPLRHGNERAGIFDMNFNIGDQIADNLRNLIQTNHGERLGHFDFGANLRPLSMELMGQEKFESEAMSRIGASVSKYLPFVRLSTMSVSRVPETEENLPQVVITLEYKVPVSDSRQRRLDVIVNLAG